MLFIDHYISIEWVCPFLRRLSSLLVNFGTSTYITCKPHPGNQKQNILLEREFNSPLTEIVLVCCTLVCSLDACVQQMCDIQMDMCRKNGTRKILE